MPVESKQLYNDFLTLAAHRINEAVYHNLSDLPLQDFMQWLLKSDNPHQEDYLRMLGVAGSIELELKLFAQVLDSSCIQDIAPYISLLNAYFGYETISDNLGVGLAENAKLHNPDYDLQKQVLLHFNQVMVAKMNGSTESIHSLLSPIKERVKKISVNKKTLAPQQMQTFIDAYNEAHKKISVSALEHSFMAILILNNATCLQLLDSMAQSAVYPLLKDSLIARYTSVNQLIQHAGQASREQLADWDLNSILTIPTLAYCIGALNEVRPYAHFNEVIDNGLLYEVLADAALLTRLLNDIGPLILRMDNQERDSLYKNLQRELTPKPSDSIFDYLYTLSQKKEFYLPLTRIRKDIQHGEFNLSLDPLASTSTFSDAFELFCQGLDYYSKMYQKRRQNMLACFDKINPILGDNKVSQIILHFVQFHEYKYSFAFESPEGDYAITGKH